MTNFVNTDVIDGAFQVIANNATHIHLCSGNPVDRAQVLSTSLASAAVSPADFTVGPGDVDGRKQTIAQKVVEVATASGSGAVVCLIDANRLLKKSLLPAPVDVFAGNPVVIATHSHTIRQPA
jgi:hypothetical protein